MIILEKLKAFMAKNKIGVVVAVVFVLIGVFTVLLFYKMLSKM